MIPIRFSRSAISEASHRVVGASPEQLKTLSNNSLQHAASDVESAPVEQQRPIARLARFLNAFIFYALLTVIALAAIPYGTVEPWWESVFEMAIFALTALCVIEVLLTGRRHLKGVRLLAPALAIAVVAFIQTLPLWKGTAQGIEDEWWRATSADPFETRLFIVKTIALVLTAELLMLYTSNARRLRLLVHVAIGIGIASAAFGIVRQTMQRSAPGFVLPYLMPGAGYAQFINRNHFAFLMEMALGLALGLVVAGSGGARRARVLLYLAAVVPLWTALVLANSRGGILSMIVQLIFIAIFLNTNRSSANSPEANVFASSRIGRIIKTPLFRLALAAGLLIVAITGAIWVGGEQLATRLDAVPGEIKTEQETNAREGVRRIEIWRATWKMIKAHPWAGVGFNAYWTAIPEYHDASGRLTPQQAHNDYLELVASGGVIAGALGVWFIYELVKNVRARLREAAGFRRAARTGAMVGIIGVAAHSSVDFGLHITINALVLIALIVIATVNIEGEENKFRRRRAAAS